MTATTVWWADRDRGAAVAGLGEAILDELAAGAVVPCVLLPGDWTSDEDDEEARYLARTCGGCPVLPACRAYIDDHPEPAGVWAGTTAKQRRTEQKMNDDETTAPERRQFDLARDALAMVRAQFTGDRQGAELLAVQLMRDPANAPGVVGSLVSMLELAVGLNAMPPAEFVAAMQRTLDDAEAGR